MKVFSLSTSLMTHFDNAQNFVLKIIDSTLSGEFFHVKISWFG